MLMYDIEIRTIKPGVKDTGWQPFTEHSISQADAREMVINIEKTDSYTYARAIRVETDERAAMHVCRD